MSLIKSISGIRGTIGGRVGDGLSPIDIARFTAAYATFIAQTAGENRKIVVGRDARISGPMVEQLVCGTLMGMGFDVVNIGLASTPTTEMAVTFEQAAGGIILTASHNPKQWNALHKDEYTQRHIEAVLALPLVDVEAIRKADFTVAVDCVNSVGGIAIPALLDALGVHKIVKLNCTPDGHFPHNPEPLPQHLTEISNCMKQGGVDVGFVVDPDVDRLAIICENGEMFGEEYTLVSVADYVLDHTPGNTVSNMSSTRALRDVTLRHAGSYKASAVGEVNVVAAMKETNAVIGGEGNGGVIYPELHYGRDALVGIALFLTQLAKKQCTVSELRASYPNYFISKNRIDLTPQIDVDAILIAMKGLYKQFETNDADGLKIDFPQGWVHLRKSNTEPIIRVYSEAPTMEQADNFARATMAEIKRLAGISEE